MNGLSEICSIVIDWRVLEEERRQVSKALRSHDWRRHGWCSHWDETENHIGPVVGILGRFDWFASRWIIFFVRRFARRAVRDMVELFGQGHGDILVVFGWSKGSSNESLWNGELLERPTDNHQTVRVGALFQFVLSIPHRVQHVKNGCNVIDWVHWYRVDWSHRLTVSLVRASTVLNKVSNGQLGDKGEKILLSGREGRHAWFGRPRGARNGDCGHCGQKDGDLKMKRPLLANKLETVQ